jgi:hypothetical protein
MPIDEVLNMVKQDKAQKHKSKQRGASTASAANVASQQSKNKAAEQGKWDTKANCTEKRAE